MRTSPRGSIRCRMKAAFLREGRHAATLLGTPFGPLVSALPANAQGAATCRLRQQARHPCQRRHRPHRQQRRLRHQVTRPAQPPVPATAIIRDPIHPARGRESPPSPHLAHVFSSPPDRLTSRHCNHSADLPAIGSLLHDRRTRLGSAAAGRTSQSRPRQRRSSSSAHITDDGSRSWHPRRSDIAWWPQPAIMTQRDNRSVA